MHASASSIIITTIHPQTPSLILPVAWDLSPQNTLGNILLESLVYSYGYIYGWKSVVAPDPFIFTHVKHTLRDVYGTFRFEFISVIF